MRNLFGMSKVVPMRIILENYGGALKTPILGGKTGKKSIIQVIPTTPPPFGVQKG